jgi:hypothetical protein
MVGSCPGAGLVGGAAVVIVTLYTNGSDQIDTA